MPDFLLDARAPGLGACLASWACYGGKGELLRDAAGGPDDWMLAGHVAVGWPRAGNVSSTQPNPGAWEVHPAVG